MSRLRIVCGVMVLCVLLAAPALGQSGPFVRGRVLVQFRPGVTAGQAREAAADAGALDAAEIPNIGVHVLELPAGASEVAVRQALSQRADVAFAELDEVRAPADITPNDPNYSTEWHLPKIGAPTAWASTTGSSSVIIAICDTGCEPTHPDLQPKYVAGWNVYDGNSNTADVAGHGTSVAGVAAAASNNGIGVASVAWGCSIMPIRMTDTNGYTTLSLAASALTWAADHGARVANMSFSLSDSSTVASAAQYFQSKGGVVAMAAGNNSTFDTAADNPYVLTVSATDQTDTICSWSNTGNNIDLAAPGYGIGTTVIGCTYGFGTGTSYSAPVVAGVAALALSVNPSLTGVQARSLLEQAVDLVGGATGWTPQYGYGRVNAAKAVSLAGGTGGGTTTNQAPTVASPASASSNPVTGTTVGLSVLGADDGGEANLTYTWSATGPAAVTYSTNGTNAAKNTTATFAAAGSYAFTATIKDSGGLSCTSSVSVTVSQTATTVTVSPASASVPVNTSQQFSSTVKDQFGTALATQPTCAWSVSGGGAIGSTGLFMACATAGGPYTVTAAVSSTSGNGSVTVTAVDTQAPTCSITSPLPGAKVSNPLSVSVSAADDVGVVKVALYVDGALYNTDTSTPWSFNVNTKKWRTGSSHTLQAYAYDAAGNCGVSAVVTVYK